MKLILSVLLVLAAAGSMNAYKIPNFGKGELHQDLQDFISEVPIDEIVMIFLQYASEDAEVQTMIGYLQSDKFKALVTDVEKLPEVHEFLNYFEDSGIFAYKIVNKLNELLEIPAISPAKLINRMVNTQITGGIAGLVKDIKAIMPFDKFKTLYEEKLQTSKAFKSFVEKLKSDTFQTLVNKVYANKNFQFLLEHAKAAGIDVKVIKDLLYAILGIKVPEKSTFFANSELEKDFHDFLNLVPVEKAEEIVKKYLNDPEVISAIEYVQSKEFKELILAVEDLKEYQKFIIYLDKAGVNVYHYIHLLHELLGLPDFVPPSGNAYNTVLKGGLKALYDELIAILPRDKIKALYYEKLENSEAFATFIKHVKSPEMQNIINALYKHEVYLNMINKAKAAGLDLDAAAKFLKEVFGLTIPSHPLA